MTRAPRYLLDVNAFVALVDEDHVHHAAMTAWFNKRGLQWGMCAFTEAGFLRYATRPTTGNMSMAEATMILEEMARLPGYHFYPLTHDWRTLTQPFARRLHGYRQVTDAFLLGLAVQEGLVLATFDRGVEHLAGEHAEHVMVLES